MAAARRNQAYHRRKACNISGIKHGGGMQRRHQWRWRKA